MPLRNRARQLSALVWLGAVSVSQLAGALEPANHQRGCDRDPHPEPDALPKSRAWVAKPDGVDRPAGSCDPTAVARWRAGERHAADGVGRNHQRVPSQRTTVGPHLRLLPPGQGPGCERRGVPPGTAAGLEQGECDMKGLQTPSPRVVLGTIPLKGRVGCVRLLDNASPHCSNCKQTQRQ